MTELDPRWEWTEVRRLGGHVRFVRGRCNHLETVPVKTGGEVVARLCLTCDQQLPASEGGEGMSEAINAQPCDCDDCTNGDDQWCCRICHDFARSI